MKKSEKSIFVIKLSGSLFFSEEFVMVTQSLSSFVKKNKTTLVLVTGGGSAARRYIETGRAVGADEASLDEIGIEVSRLNALATIISLKGLTWHAVPTTLREVVEAFERLNKQKKIVVCGGLHPGQSTNAVAALIAEKVRASEFVNSTDVDGVYAEDPARSSSARKLEGVTPKRLDEILRSGSMQAGAYDLMDSIALKIIARSKIPTRIVKCDSYSIMRALAGEEIGTKIVFENEP